MSKDPRIIRDDTKDGPKRERKSRRSHKNSRDGCPNCRTKRIKCTEELPSCMNCVKKGYRCGYLDFAPERLEVIRKKNIVKRLHNSSQSAHEISSKMESDRSITPCSDIASADTSLEVPKRGNKHRASVKMRAQDRPQAAFNAPSPMTDLRSLVYQNALKQVTHDGDIPAQFDQADLWESKFAELPEDFFLHDMELFSPVGTALESTSCNSSSHNIPPSKQENQRTHEIKDRWLFETEKSLQHTKRHNHLSQQFQLETSRMLPNGHIVNRTFCSVPVPEKLRNNLLAKARKMFKTSDFSLKSVVNDQFGEIPRAVWSDEQLKLFWVYVFHQAAMLNLYFLYFIDKSVNILMRASHAVVNGDIDISTPSSSESGTSSPNESPRAKASFLYTRRNLSRLTLKSYATYGRIMRELRLSINKYHNEYPAKISLYSAWACYLNIASDVQTFGLMLTGTFVLIHNVLYEVNSVLELSLAFALEIILLNSFSSAAQIPDYKFDVIRDVADIYRLYQSIVNEFICQYENGYNFDTDLVQVLRDPVFRHDFLELGKFLDRLQAYYYPLITETNLYYQSQPYTKDLKYVSPTLVFQMAFEWFQVYRGDTMTMNSHSNPLRRTLQFMFHALGKCLAHVFTPIRSVLFVDPCNVMFAKVGTVMTELDPLHRPMYERVSRLALGLVKTVKFFENRLRLYGYNVVETNMLDHEFLQHVPTQAPSQWKYRDIVHVAAAKVTVKETQVASISKSVLMAENYAFFPEILNDPTAASLIQYERDRQSYAVKNLSWEFNYATGTLNHDFDPTAVIDRYLKMQTQAPPKLAAPALEKLRAQNNEMLRSREVVKNAILRCQK